MHCCFAQKGLWSYGQAAENQAHIRVSLNGRAVESGVLFVVHIESLANVHFVVDNIQFSIENDAEESVSPKYMTEEIRVLRWACRDDLSIGQHHSHRAH